MNRTLRCSCAILGLWSWLSTPPVIAALDSAQATGSASKGPALAFDINDLFRHWVRSSEEEQPGGRVQIFRPAASRAFPPSRFRHAYKFARNGSCEFYFLSPDDAHRFRPCEWRIGASDRTILQIIAGDKTTSYRIAELSGEMLRLTPLDPPRDQ